MKFKKVYESLAMAGNDFPHYVMCSAASSRVQQPVTSVYRTDAPSVGTRLVIATEKQDR